MRRYSDPTANTAIANVMRETKRKEREQQRDREREQRKPAPRSPRSEKSGDSSF